MMSSTETSNVSTSYRETDPLVQCERTGTRNKLGKEAGGEALELKKVSSFTHWKINFCSIIGMINNIKQLLLLFLDTNYFILFFFSPFVTFIEVQTSGGLDLTRITMNDTRNKVNYLTLYLVCYFMGLN